MFKRSFLLLLIAGLVLAGCNINPANSAPPATVVPGQNPLKIVFLDVGQGDSILIQAPNGQTMLIDGGRSTNLANTVIIPKLQEWGAKQVDVLIPTHPDQDHPFRAVAQAELDPCPGADFGQVPGNQADPAQPQPAYGVRGSLLPQHRRMFQQRHGHFHDPG